MVPVMHNPESVLYFTNAPEAYDYDYCTTVGMVCGMGDWRVVLVTDPKRFREYQIPRYQSGLYSAHAPGSTNAGYMKLPTIETPAELCNAICGPNDCKGGCQ